MFSYNSPLHANLLNLENNSHNLQTFIKESTHLSAKEK